MHVELKGDESALDAFGEQAEQVKFYTHPNFVGVLHRDGGVRALGEDYGQSERVRPHGEPQKRGEDEHVATRNQAR